MLIIVSVLVMVAFGLLVGALTTANTLFAWISVAVSVAAAAILVVDWLRARRRKTEAVGSAESAPVVVEDDEGVDVDRVGVDRADVNRAGVEPEPVVEAEPVAVVTSDAASVAESADLPQDEPAEEATDAADLLVVSDLDAEVRVLDERPRYHLSRCGFIAGRPSLTLPVSEARQLGFTPCALCTPDAVLAARHREGRGAAEQPREAG